MMLGPKRRYYLKKSVSLAPPEGSSRVVTSDTGHKNKPEAGDEVAPDTPGKGQISTGQAAVKDVSLRVNKVRASSARLGLESTRVRVPQVDSAPWSRRSSSSLARATSVWDHSLAPTAPPSSIWRGPSSLDDLVTPSSLSPTTTRDGSTERLRRSLDVATARRPSSAAVRRAGCSRQRNSNNGEGVLSSPRRLVRDKSDNHETVAESSDASGRGRRLRSPRGHRRSRSRSGKESGFSPGSPRHKGRSPLKQSSPRTRLPSFAAQSESVGHVGGSEVAVKSVSEESASGTADLKLVSATHRRKEKPPAAALETLATHKKQGSQSNTAHDAAATRKRKTSTSNVALDTTAKHTRRDHKHASSRPSSALASKPPKLSGARAGRHSTVPDDFETVSLSTSLVEILQDNKNTQQPCRAETKAVTLAEVRHKRRGGAASPQRHPYALSDDDDDDYTSPFEKTGVVASRKAGARSVTSRTQTAQRSSILKELLRMRRPASTVTAREFRHIDPDVSSTTGRGESGFSRTEEASPGRESKSGVSSPQLKREKISAYLKQVEKCEQASVAGDTSEDLTRHWPEPEGEGSGRRDLKINHAPLGKEIGHVTRGRGSRTSPERQDTQGSRFRKLTSAPTSLSQAQGRSPVMPAARVTSLTPSPRQTTARSDTDVSGKGGHSSLTSKLDGGLDPQFSPLRSPRHLASRRVMSDVTLSQSETHMKDIVLSVRPAPRSRSRPCFSPQAASGSTQQHQKLQREQQPHQHQQSPKLQLQQQQRRDRGRAEHFLDRGFPPKTLTSAFDQLLPIGEEPGYEDKVTSIRHWLETTSVSRISLPASDPKATLNFKAERSELSVELCNVGAVHGETFNIFPGPGNIQCKDARSKPAPPPKMVGPAVEKTSFWPERSSPKRVAALAGAGHTLGHSSTQRRGPKRHMTGSRRGGECVRCVMAFCVLLVTLELLALGVAFLWHNRLVSEVWSLGGALGGGLLGNVAGAGGATDAAAAKSE